MKPVRIFRHITCEGPGYLADFLSERQIPWELVAIDQDESVPDQLDDVSGLVFMGGPMSVNDELSWIQDELALIKRAAARQLPVLGHCLGGQLISKALGGEVGPNHVKEIGWFPVNTYEHDDWTADIPSGFTPYHWHGETFSLPDGANLLLTNAHCAHQAFAVDNILAFQCHVEMTSDMVHEWANLYNDEIEADRPRFPSTIQSQEEQITNLDQRIHEAQGIASLFYEKWISRLPQ